MAGVAARLQTAESKVETFEATIVDAQRKIGTITAAGASRTVGAADPWQPTTFEQAAPTATAVSAPERYDLDGGAGERRPFGWKL